MAVADRQARYFWICGLLLDQGRHAWKTINAAVEQAVPFRSEPLLDTPEGYMGVLAAAAGQLGIDPAAIVLRREAMQ